jgi:hypothetical protein
MKQPKKFKTSVPFQKFFRRQNSFLKKKLTIREHNLMHIAWGSATIWMHDSIVAMLQGKEY